MSAMIGGTSVERSWRCFVHAFGSRISLSSFFWIIGCVCVCVHVCVWMCVCVCVCANKMDTDGDLETVLSRIIYTQTHTHTHLCQTVSRSLVYSRLLRLGMANVSALWVFLVFNEILVLERRNIFYYSTWETITDMKVWCFKIPIN